MLEDILYNDRSDMWEGLLTGELDAVSAPQLIEEITRLIDEHPSSVTLDCVRLDFIDSLGLGAMVKIRKLVEEKGGAIKLINVKKRIFKLFVITGLENSFGIEVG